MEDLKKFLEKKFSEKFSDKVDPFKYFFGHIIKPIETEDKLDMYAVHNFTGAHSMSNAQAADRTVDYIIAEGVKTHIDIGGSRAYLSMRLATQGNIDSYTLDGWTYGIDNNLLEIDISKYVVCDMVAFDFKGLDLEKYFEVSTAFEITEHIHEKDIKTFYDNVSYMSKSHICSIHVGGLDSTMGVETNHHNVKDMVWWTNFLTQYGHVTHMGHLKPTWGWDESEILKVDFK